MKKDGTPCRNGHALKGDPPTCLFHSPDRVEELREFQAKGRRARRLIKCPRSLETAADLARALDYLWFEVSAQRLTKDDATVLLRVIDLRAKLLDDQFTTELGDQLRGLQRDLSMLKGKVA